MTEIDRLRDQPTGVVYNDHRPVVQVGYALVVFFTLFQDEDAHGFARQNDRLEGIRELIDIEDFDAVELCNLVQVEVVGDYFAFVQLAEFDQLHVDVADMREIFFQNWTVICGIFWMRCRTSRPRRPRFRFSESAESATS